MKLIVNFKDHKMKNCNQILVTLLIFLLCSLIKSSNQHVPECRHGKIPQSASDSSAAGEVILNFDDCWMPLTVPTETPVTQVSTEVINFDEDKVSAKEGTIIFLGILIFFLLFVGGKVLFCFFCYPQPDLPLDQVITHSYSPNPHRHIVYYTLPSHTPGSSATPTNRSNSLIDFGDSKPGPSGVSSSKICARSEKLRKNNNRKIPTHANKKYDNTKSALSLVQSTTSSSAASLTEIK